MNRAILGVLWALACLLSSPLFAATFTVDSTADAPDQAPGNGVCATAAGACTLRAAVQETNALAGPDTIVIASGIYTLSIGSGVADNVAADGDLDITADLTINGAGAASTIIDGGSIDRVFHIDPARAGITAVISGVTVRNGNAQFDGSDGGGILNQGTLTLTSSIVSGNFARSDGGGIASFGTINISGSTISGNTSSFDAGGILIEGPTTTATITNSVISGNIAVDSAGIQTGNGASLILRDSNVSGNTAQSFDSGGIAHESSGVLTTERSTISGNSSSSDGGGLAVKNGTGSLVNSTISGNSSGNSGGGFLHESSAGFSILNSTIASNSAVQAGRSGIHRAASAASGTLTMTNSIVALNTNGNCSGAGIVSGETTSTVA